MALLLMLFSAVTQFARTRSASIDLKAVHCSAMALLAAVTRNPKRSDSSRILTAWAACFREGSLACFARFPRSNAIDRCPRSTRLLLTPLGTRAARRSAGQRLPRTPRSRRPVRPSSFGIVPLWRHFSSAS